MPAGLARAVLDAPVTDFVVHNVQSGYVQMFSVVTCVACEFGLDNSFDGSRTALISQIKRGVRPMKSARGKVEATLLPAQRHT